MFLTAVTITHVVPVAPGERLVFRAGQNGLRQFFNRRRRCQERLIRNLSLRSYQNFTLSKDSVTLHSREP